MNVGNISTAMITPFDSKGNVDFQKLSTLIDYLLKNGTDSLVVAGTTGESPTLSTEEKIALFEFTVKEVNGRVPVIAGTGSNNTKDSIKLTKKAEEAGVDCVMLVTPYYNKPSQEGMYVHALLGRLIIIRRDKHNAIDAGFFSFFCQFNGVFCIVASRTRNDRHASVHFFDCKFKECNFFFR